MLAYNVCIKENLQLVHSPHPAPPPPKKQQQPRCFTNHFNLGVNLLTFADMPTSGDLKSGDCLFFTTPAPPGISMTPPPKKKIDPAPNVNDLGHYMTSYMMNILSKFEIIVLMLQKCPRNRTAKKKNSSFELKMG